MRSRLHARPMGSASSRSLHPAHRPGGLHLPGCRFAFWLERHQRPHSLPYRRLDERHLPAEHVGGLLAEFGLFPHQTKEFLAGDAQNYSVGDRGGGKAVWTSGEGCRQAQQRSRRKYSIKARQAVDPKTYFPSAHQVYAEVLIAGIEQGISGWNLLRCPHSSLCSYARMETGDAVTSITHRCEVEPAGWPPGQDHLSGERHSCGIFRTPNTSG